MSKKKEYIQQGTCRLNRLETIKEFMVAAIGSQAISGLSYYEEADEVYTRAVACWEVLCKNEGGDE